MLKRKRETHEDLEKPDSKRRNIGDDDSSPDLEIEVSSPTTSASHLVEDELDPRSECPGCNQVSLQSDLKRPASDRSSDPRPCHPIFHSDLVKHRDFPLVVTPRRDTANYCEKCKLESHRYDLVRYLVSPGFLKPNFFIVIEFSRRIEVYKEKCGGNMIWKSLHFLNDLLQDRLEGGKESALVENQSFALVEAQEICRSLLSNPDVAEKHIQWSIYLRCELWRLLSFKNPYSKLTISKAMRRLHQLNTFFDKYDLLSSNSIKYERERFMESLKAAQNQGAAFDEKNTDRMVVEETKKALQVKGIWRIWSEYFREVRRCVGLDLKTGRFVYDFTDIENK